MRYGYRLERGHKIASLGVAKRLLRASLMSSGVHRFSAAKSGQNLNLRMQPGYDHGYYFIQTFMADHLRHHAQHLARAD